MLIRRRFLLCFRYALQIAFGEDHLRRYAIHADAIRSRLRGDVLRQNLDSGLGLINDASGLLALQFATATLVRNEVPGVSSGALTFLWLMVGGVGLGLA